MLESYGRSLEKDRPKDLEACMRAYLEERQKTFEDFFSSEAQFEALTFENSKLVNQQAKAAVAAAKEEEKAWKARQDISC